MSRDGPWAISGKLRNHSSVLEWKTMHSEAGARGSGVRSLPSEKMHLSSDDSTSVGTEKPTQQRLT